MRRLAVYSLLAGAFALTGVAPAAAQGESELLPVGAAAPDFELPGATRHGLLASPVSLSEYRGETVVLAFFYRVRTPG
jgi:peroxiredoxin Q/BCP